MPEDSRQPLTALLRAWNAGDRGALDRLVPLVQAELRQLAASHLKRERADHTLQPTALVNEVYLRLVGAANVRWEDRAHFFGIAARLMRQILVDHARRRRAAKRGGLATRVTLEDALAASEREVDMEALDEALERLGALDARQARVVELRFFGGLDVEETAEVLRVSPTTVKREWRSARAWLYRELVPTPER